MCLLLSDPFAVASKSRNVSDYGLMMNSILRYYLMCPMHGDFCPEGAFDGGAIYLGYDVHNLRVLYGL